MSSASHHSLQKRVGAGNPRPKPTVISHRTVRVTHAATTNRFGVRAAARVVFWVAASVVLMSGCTSSHYRRSADKEVYGIIRQIDNQVFGRTNAFTIDTPFSGRDPKTIPPDEIIEGRTATNRLMLNLGEALDFAVRNSRESTVRLTSVASHQRK